ncbi:hypothetical protein JZO77_12430 [Enterococcus hulanensis]|uniref:hypothetical protein n=1 Tax=Enterococcus hulanensis TaxID=2559929 RepID=UPI001A8CB6A3|nr:hypothetical protein [Enterococcus hulanensis]MBO0457537.1 hypothetical protein [Enterococcus hulanensis]
MKNDIKEQIEQLLIVIVSGILAYFFPLATKFLNINSETILAGFDIAFFSTLLNIIWLKIQTQLHKKMMKIEISIKSSEQESNKVYFSNETTVVDITVFIEVTGRKLKCKNNLILKCPESYVLQINRNVSYIEEIETSEIYEIDINKMMEKSSDFDIHLNRKIPFSISLEDHNKGDEDDLKFEKEQVWGRVSIESKKIELIQK